MSLPSGWSLRAGEPHTRLSPKRRRAERVPSARCASAVTATLSVIVSLMLKCLLAFAANSSFLVPLVRD